MVWYAEKDIAIAYQRTLLNRPERADFAALHNRMTAKIQS
jgi:hypothetical protein